MLLVLWMEYIFCAKGTSICELTGGGVFVMGRLSTTFEVRQERDNAHGHHKHRSWWLIDDECENEPTEITHEADTHCPRDHPPL